MFKDSNVIMWLSRREEKKILKLCKSHLDKIVETVEEMKWVVHSFCNEDFNALEEHYKKAYDNEREADDIAENAKSGARKLRLASTKCLND